MIDRDQLNVQKELLAHAYSQAQAYTNVVLLAGYAGFFAIWAFLKPDLSKSQIFWSGLLIALSLGTYVLWEVYQSFFRSQSLLGLSRAVQDPANFQRLFIAHKRAEQERVIRFGQAWLVAFTVTVVAGVAAIGILLWAFVSTLWALHVV
jgi:hypothetical protein